METAASSVCPMCFDSKPLKFVGGRCKHKFCAECMSIALGCLASESQVFECPSCKADCPVPWNGVDGLVDFVEGGASDIAVAQFAAQQEPARDQVSCSGQLITVDKGIDICRVARKVNCGICLHRKKEVKAIRQCVQCGDLNLCQECTGVHEKNKLTQGHRLVALDTRKEHEEAVCKMHSSPLDTYCHTCSKAVCMICVMLEHGDHNVEKLEDTILAKSEEIKVAVAKRVQELHELRNLSDEVTWLQSEVKANQDNVIERIEDHAQTSIDQILQRKEELKQQVKVVYNDVSDNAAEIEKFSATFQRLNEPTTRAVASVSRFHPCDLEEQIKLLHDLKVPFEFDGDALRESRKKLRLLYRNRLDFDQGEQDQADFGELIKPDRNQRKFKVEVTFDHTMTAYYDSSKWFIPCVADLTSCFAIALPTKRGQVSNTIFIYANDCDLQRTITEHLVYDMCKVYDGQLAVLSSSTDIGSFGLKIFDPKSGCLNSECNLEVANPISLDASLDGRFAILCENEHRQKCITVVDKDGTEKHKYVIGASDGLKNPNRIAWGRKFIFVKGTTSVGIYKINVCPEEGLQRIKTCSGFNCKYLTDITATPLDDFFVADSDPPNLYLQRFLHSEDEAEYSSWWQEVVSNVRGTEREARISVVAGDDVVMSNGVTFMALRIIN